MAKRMRLKRLSFEKELRAPGPIVSTGTRERRKISSATDPNNNFSVPVRPLVPTMIRSMSSPCIACSTADHTSMPRCIVVSWCRRQAGNAMRFISASAFSSSSSRAAAANPGPVYG